MVHHLTTIKTPAQSPVNRLNGYSIPTALGFASGVSGQHKDEATLVLRRRVGTEGDRGVVQ